MSIATQFIDFPIARVLVYRKIMVRQPDWVAVRSPPWRHEVFLATFELVVSYENGGSARHTHCLDLPCAEGVLMHGLFKLPPHINNLQVVRNQDRIQL